LAQAPPAAVSAPVSETTSCAVATDPVLYAARVRRLKADKPESRQLIRISRSDSRHF
jgi:hypothetical protein